MQKRNLCSSGIPQERVYSESLEIAIFTVIPSSSMNTKEKHQLTKILLPSLRTVSNCETITMMHNLSHSSGWNAEET